MTPEESKYLFSAFRSLKKAVILSCQELDEMRFKIENTGGVKAISYNHVGGSSIRSGGSVIEDLAIQYERLRLETAEKFSQMTAQEAKITAIVDEVADSEAWFFLHSIINGNKFVKERSDPRTKSEIETAAFAEFARIASAQDTKK